MFELFSAASSIPTNPEREPLPPIEEPEPEVESEPEPNSSPNPEPAEPEPGLPPELNPELCC